MPAHLVAIDNSEREFETYQFVIPDNISFEDYFLNQIDDPDFELIEGVNYRIRN